MGESESSVARSSQSVRANRTRTRNPCYGLLPKSWEIGATAGFPARQPFSFLAGFCLHSAAADANLILILPCDPREARR